MQGPWFLYLDESGDLGFDEGKRGRSHFFTLCILAIRNSANNRTIAAAIRKTLKRKVNPKSKRKRIIEELKGSSSSHEVKQYFFRQVTGVHFGIYCMTLNKERVYPYLQENKEAVYNFLSRLILEQLPFESADTSVHLTLDRCKNKPKTHEFNLYIKTELRSRLAPHIPLFITHEDSKANSCLQAVDLFCHGVFRKYERADTKWYDVFKGKVRYDNLYLPPKKESVPCKP